MKRKGTWILCLLIAWCGQGHAMSNTLEKLRDPDRHIDMDIINDLYLMGDDALPFLVQTLTDEEPDVRLKVVSLLTDYYFDPDALSALTVIFLHDTDDRVRSMAAYGIASIDIEYANKLMGKHLNAGGETQEIVMDVLSKYGDERVISKLVERLEDPKAHPEVRRHTAYALVDFFKDKRAVPILLDMIDYPEIIEPKALAEVLERLARIDDERVIPVLLNLPDSAIGYIDHILPQFGNLIVPLLWEKLAQTELESVRKDILRILKNIRDPAAAAFYGHAYLETEDPELRYRLIFALTNMGAEGFRTLLDIVRQEPNSEVLRALTRYNSSAAVDTVAAFALDRSFPLREEAINTLASFGQLRRKEVSKYIPQLLADPNPKVKLLTMRLIIRGRLPAFFPALEALRQDTDENIRNAADITACILSGEALLKLEVGTDRQQYDYGQPIMLNYRLRNVSNYPIKIARVPEAHLREYLRIQQPDGTTARARISASFFSPKFEDYRTLHPGDELTGTISIISISEERETYWLHQSGKYTVDLHIYSWGSGLEHGFLAWPDSITSTFDFNIKPPTIDHLDAILTRTDVVDSRKTYHQLSELKKSGIFPVLETPVLSYSQSWIPDPLEPDFLNLSNTELISKGIKMLPYESGIKLLTAIGDAQAIEALRQTVFKREVKIGDTPQIRVSTDAAFALQQLGDNIPIKWCREFAQRRLRHWKKSERVKGAEILLALQRLPIRDHWHWDPPTCLTSNKFYSENDSPSLAANWEDIIEKAATLPGLKSLLEHDIPIVRRAAAYELAYLGDPSGISMIEPDLYANDAATRGRAGFLIGKFQSQ